MEKLRPHYDLQRFKKLFRDKSARRITGTSRRGALGLGYTVDSITEIIKSLKNANFYKSMTSHLNAKIWQDVYKIKDQGNDLYIKLQIVDENAVLIQFKEDESVGGENG